MLTEKIAVAIIAIFVIVIIKYKILRSEKFYNNRLYYQNNNYTNNNDNDNAKKHGIDDTVNNVNENKMLCPPCPACVCQSCPSEYDIIAKYLYNQQNNNTFANNRYTYNLVGYLTKEQPLPNDKYNMLPVYGREYKGGFYKYYVQFVMNMQMFRKYIYKFPTEKGREFSREIYDGDTIELDSPFNSKYTFKEEKLDNRIDLYQH